MSTIIIHTVFDFADYTITKDLMSEMARCATRRFEKMEEKMKVW